MEKEETSIIELTEESMESMVYSIRGVKVMLDFDLARIYGYSTKAFNQQVKNNIGKFPPDFMFQLTSEEVDEISRSKNLTTIKSSTESEDLVRCKNFTARIILLFICGRFFRHQTCYHNKIMIIYR